MMGSRLWTLADDVRGEREGQAVTARQGPSSQGLLCAENVQSPTRMFCRTTKSTRVAFGDRVCKSASDVRVEKWLLEGKRDLQDAGLSSAL
jgi:hypothetical protein